LIGYIDSFSYDQLKTDLKEVLHMWHATVRYTNSLHCRFNLQCFFVPLSICNVLWQWYWQLFGGML
jgi:hypothetical protein